MFKKIFFASAFLVLSTLGASAQTGDTSTHQTKPATKPATTAKKPATAAQKTTAAKPAAAKQATLPPGADPEAIFDTSVGKLKCTLFPKQAPKTVENFIGLAE